MTDEIYRRRVLASLGTGVAVGLAGCSSGGDGTNEDDEDDQEEGDQTEAGTDGAGTTDGGASTADGATATDGDGTTSESGGGTTESGGNGSGDTLHSPGSGVDYDWAAIAERDEANTFDLPDDAPTGWGFQRAGNELTLMIPEGFDSGTVYLVFVTDGNVSQILVLESSFDGTELVIGPEDSAYSMDVEAADQLSVAWEKDGELYVVQKFDEYFRVAPPADQ